jgi:hypothetical protein
MEGLAAKELKARAGWSPGVGEMEQRTVRVRVVTGEGRESDEVTK